MSSRAFTLIEVVFSLVLLATLSVATVSWTTSAVRLQADTLTTAGTAWADASFERLLRADLVAGDLATNTLARRNEHVWVDANTLHVLTRDRGPAEVIYTFDERSGLLNRTVRGLSTGSDRSESVLLETLTGCAFTLDAPRDRPWGTLSVEWTRSGNGTGSVRVTVPREWLP